MNRERERKGRNYGQREIGKERRDEKRDKERDSKRNETDQLSGNPLHENNVARFTTPLLNILTNS